MQYTDIDSTTKVTPVYKWGELYGIFNNKNYPSIEDEYGDDLGVYLNVRRSKLHRVATRPEVFPCTDVISWIIPIVDIDNMIIMNEEGYKVISSL